MPHSTAQRDLAECTFEAEKATAAIGTGDNPKSMSDAIAEGISDAMEQSDLVKSCMRARGYTQSYHAVVGSF